jgi:hypothetical protein
VGKFVTRWLMTQDTDLCQKGQGRTFHDVVTVAIRGENTEPKICTLHEYKMQNIAHKIEKYQIRGKFKYP